MSVSLSQPDNYASGPKGFVADVDTEGLPWHPVAPMPLPVKPGLHLHVAPVSGASLSVHVALALQGLRPGAQ